MLCELVRRDDVEGGGSTGRGDLLGEWRGGRAATAVRRERERKRELVMLNAAQRNRRYRTLRTLQLTKQITLNQRTPTPRFGVRDVTVSAGFLRLRPRAIP